VAVIFVMGHEDEGRCGSPAMVGGAAVAICAAVPRAIG
jgi:hypothetical protein